MYAPSAFRDYVRRLNDSISLGNATEHTHRPALKALLEAAFPGVTATNEPRRIECGAPDFAVSRNGATVGYVEAKDCGFSLDTIERDSRRGKPGNAERQAAKAVHAVPAQPRAHQLHRVPLVRGRRKTLRSRASQRRTLLAGWSRTAQPSATPTSCCPPSWSAAPNPYPAPKSLRCAWRDLRT